MCLVLVGLLRVLRLLLVLLVLAWMWAVSMLQSAPLGPAATSWWPQQRSHDPPCHTATPLPPYAHLHATSPSSLPPPCTPQVRAGADKGL